jgi:hypothetical protein
MPKAVRRSLLSVVCTMALTLGVVVSVSGCGGCDGASDVDTPTSSCLPQACGGSPVTTTYDIYGLGSSGGSGGLLRASTHTSVHHPAVLAAEIDDDNDCT